MADESNFNKSTEIDPDDVARKAQEAFREFELKQKALREQQQKPSIVETPKIDESLKFKGVDEIEESLKKFEEKSVEEQQQKQSIENPNIRKDTSRMVRLTMKLSGGLIKEEKQAEYIMLAFAVLVFLVSGYLFFIGLGGNKKMNPKIPAEVLDKMKQMQFNQNNVNN